MNENFLVSSDSNCSTETWPEGGSRQQQKDHLLYYEIISNTIWKKKIYKAHIPVEIFNRNVCINWSTEAIEMIKKWICTENFPFNALSETSLLLIHMHLPLAMFYQTWGSSFTSLKNNQTYWEKKHLVFNKQIDTTLASHWNIEELLNMSTMILLQISKLTWLKLYFIIYVCMCYM